LIGGKNRLVSSVVSDGRPLVQQATALCVILVLLWLLLILCFKQWRETRLKIGNIITEGITFINFSARQWMVDEMVVDGGELGGDVLWSDSLSDLLTMSHSLESNETCCLCCLCCVVFLTTCCAYVCVFHFIIIPIIIPDRVEIIIQYHRMLH
jgi:hypothetical protein